MSVSEKALSGDSVHVISVVEESRQQIMKYTEEDGSVQVTCGQLFGRLHLPRFRCPGIHIKCIEYRERFYTPREFCALALKHRQKDWKGSIRIGRRSLRWLMETRLIDFHNHWLDCTRRCVSPATIFNKSSVAGSDQESVGFSEDSLELSPPCSQSMLSQDLMSCSQPNSLPTLSQELSQGKPFSPTDYEVYTNRVDNSQSTLFSCTGSQKDNFEQKYSKRNQTVNLEPSTYHSPQHINEEDFDLNCVSPTVLAYGCFGLDSSGQKLAKSSETKGGNSSRACDDFFDDLRDFEEALEKRRAKKRKLEDVKDNRNAKDISKNSLLGLRNGVTDERRGPHYLLPLIKKRKELLSEDSQELSPPFSQTFQDILSYSQLELLPTLSQEVVQRSTPSPAVCNVYLNKVVSSRLVRHSDFVGKTKMNEAEVQKMEMKTYTNQMATDYLIEEHQPLKREKIVMDGDNIYVQL